MTRITFQDDKVVMREGSVGTEEACCCEQCVCPTCPERSVSVKVDYCGMSAEIVLSVPGLGNTRVNDVDNFLDLSAEIACGELGPSGQCGWLLLVLVCFACNGSFNGEGFSAFIEQDEDGCPEVGPAGLVCLSLPFFGCATAPTASVS